MTWLNTLDVNITEALDRFPSHVPVASVEVDRQVYLIALASLKDMVQMALGHLPLKTIALPYEISDILTRPHEENLIKDVSHHLSDYFPNFFVAAIYELQSLFTGYHQNAYIIGGITRDMLLSPERRFDIQDVDVLIEGNALEAARYVDSVSKNFDLLQAFEAFNTAKVDYKGEIELDFASTRREIYQSCGALPEVVEIGVPLEEDIIRRDFTMNALALSIVHPGQIIDCCGGLKDLETRLLRLLKTPSFFEDPSRILRAYRNAIRMELDFAPDTQLLLDQFLQWMPQVYRGGGDRIRAELACLLCLPESDLKAKWLDHFLEKGLHRLIDTSLPEQLDLPISQDQFSAKLQRMQSVFASQWTETLSWELYLAFLLLGLPKASIGPAMHRIELTRHEIEVVEKSLRLLQENYLHAVTPEDSAVKLYEVFHGLPMAAALMGIVLSSQFENVLEAFVKYKRDYATVKLEINGDDILKLGVPQGEQVGRLLKEVLYAKLQGKVYHRIEELNWVKALLQESNQEQRL